MDAVFRWNDYNLDHIAEHGVTPAETEHVVRNAGAPFPRSIGDEKYLVWGRSADGAYLQVIFIYSPADTVYVIHARPLTGREKKSYRRHRR